MKANLKSIALCSTLMFCVSNFANAAVYRWSFADTAIGGGIFAYLDFDTVGFDFRLADNNGQHPETSLINPNLTGNIGVNGIAFNFVSNVSITPPVGGFTTAPGAWGNTTIGNLNTTTTPALPSGYEVGFASPDNSNNNEIQNGESTMFNFGSIAFSNISAISLRVNQNDAGNLNGGRWVAGQLVNNGQPVPEAETFAMFLAGLGLLGFVSRRRKA